VMLGASVDVVVGSVDGLSLHPLAPTQTPTPSHIFIFDTFVAQYLYLSTFLLSALFR